MSESKIDISEPAFPTEVVGSTEPGRNWHQTGPNSAQFHGLTMRDYFAAKAMHGMLASTYLRDEYDVTLANEFAANAYVFADAMLEARK